MKKAKPIRMEGKPGNWVALAGRPRKEVAQATTLKAVAAKVKARGYEHPAFARVPKATSSLVL